jgi:hypothetical protein
MEGSGRGPLDIEARPRHGRGVDVSVRGFGGGGGIGPAFVYGPPWSDRPPSATDFNLFGTLFARTNANTPTTFPTAQFQVPGGNVAVIRSLSILANNLLTTSVLRWDLLFNNAPAPGWSGLTINPRAAGSVEVSWTPEETFIPVPEGALIDWRFTVDPTDGGTYQVSIAYHGWLYPLALHMAALAGFQG